MLILVAVVILFITTLALWILRLSQKGKSYAWLLTTLSALVSWVLIFLSRSQIPWALELPSPLLNAPPYTITLLGDNLSGALTLALSALLLGTMLTGSIYPPEGEFLLKLACCASITALSILTCISGNLYSLLIFWTFLDFLQFIVKQVFTENKEPTLFHVKDLGLRIISTFLAMTALLLDPSATSFSTGYASQQPITEILFIAAGLRLGTLFIYQPASYMKATGRTLDPILKLAPFSAGLILTLRLSGDYLTPSFSILLFIPLFLVALSSCFDWLITNGDLPNLSAWMTGCACLVFASAIFSLPQAGIAWGVALLLIGGGISLFSLHRRWLMILPVLGGLCFSALPFTPTWQGVWLFLPPTDIYSIFMLLVFTLLLGGYLHHILKPAKERVEGERWAWLIYPWGLVLLLVNQFIIFLWYPPIQNEAITQYPSWIESLPAGVGTFLSIGVAVLLKNNLVPLRFLKGIASFLRFSWLSKVLYKFLELAGRMIAFIHQLLESEAGILWSLFFLFLFITAIWRTVSGD